jgi:hypothetical protein
MAPATQGAPGGPSTGAGPTAPPSDCAAARRIDRALAGRRPPYLRHVGERLRGARHARAGVTVVVTLVPGRLLQVLKAFAPPRGAGMHVVEVEREPPRDAEMALTGPAGTAFVTLRPAACEGYTRVEVAFRLTG